MGNDLKRWRIGLIGYGEVGCILAEEVREVAQMVHEAGLDPWSATGTSERQAWVADLADAGVFGARGTKEFARSPDWRTKADRILQHLKKN
jgi:methionine synthase II (cobalamin-independent)